METLGKQVSFQMKVAPGMEKYYNETQLSPKTGIIESFIVKLDKPRYASGFGSNQEDTTHVKVGGPGDNYTVVNTSKGGKRKTRKSKQSKKSKKTRKH